MAQSFIHTMISGFVVCMIAVLLWAAIGYGLYRRRGFLLLIAIVAVGDALIAGWGIYPQQGREKYYPRSPILQALARAPAGRMCGVHCFPACLPETAGLLDVRGYDGVDPSALVELLQLTQPDLLSFPVAGANVLQEYTPRTFPSPLTRMIDLRYLIFEGLPAANQHAILSADGFWVLEDAGALPRVFVPAAAVVVDDRNSRLELLGRADFDPGKIAYLQTPGVPVNNVSGAAQITSELPSHITIQYDMKSPGIVVLSDSWDPGWRARVNGTLTHVIRANHAFRAVAVPAGKGTIQYDYEPASFYGGLKIAGISAAILLAWSIASTRIRESSPASGERASKQARAT